MFHIFKAFQSINIICPDHGGTDLSFESLSKPALADQSLQKEAACRSVVSMFQSPYSGFIFIYTRQFGPQSNTNNKFPLHKRLTALKD